jgi:histidinol-phosphate aminotransferase
LKVRETILNIKPYVPGKPIEEVQRELGIDDVIKLASNENSLGPSPKAIEAMREAASRMHIYPDGNSYELKMALSSRLGLTTSHLILGNGSDELLELIAKAFLEEGQETIYGHPSFSEYEFVTLLMGGKGIPVPLRDFAMDLEAIAGAVTERTRLIFLCTPNNPTGKIIKQKDLDSFLESLRDDIIVILDQAYLEYVEDPEHPNGLEEVKAGKNLILLRTFSKAYGLAGLRVGYGISTPEIIGYLNRVKEPFNVNLMGQVAALASLEDEEHLNASVGLVAKEKAYLYSELEKRGITYVPSETNFIFMDVKMNSKEFFEKMLRKGVIIRTGDIFGYPTFIRITIGTRQENQRFLNALDEVIGRD